MGLSADQLRISIDALSELEPAIGASLARIGYPEPRIRDPGYETLLRTIVGQQVSVAAAASIWRKLEVAVGAGLAPEALLDASDEALRGAGLSRQKASYARSLAEELTSGRLDLHALPDDDEEAITALTAIRGIGRWSAEIYLLFAEGRSDVWPAGDLAVQIALGKLKGLEARPSERLTRTLAEGWSPHRGAAAIFLWHHYGNDKNPV
ncbi:MAG: DNA-3-methyladenine glycosylase [Sphingomonadaceae bacterium]